MKWKSFHLEKLSMIDSSYEGGDSTALSEMIKLSWKKEYISLKENCKQKLWSQDIELNYFQF